VHGLFVRKKDYAKETILHLRYLCPPTNPSILLNVLANRGIKLPA